MLPWGEGGRRAGGFRGEPSPLLCQLPAKSLRGLPGSQAVSVARGSEWPRVPMRDRGAALIPFSSPSWLCSPVQTCSGWGGESGADLAVLGCAEGQRDKNVSRLHLEQEKVFPLGFYNSRKAGFYFCCLRQKNPLRSRLPAAVPGGRPCMRRAGGLGSALLSLPRCGPRGPWMLMLASTKEKRRFWCP